LRPFANPRPRLVPLPAATPPLRFHVLGGIALAGAVDPAAADRLLAQPKAVALLVYLALAAAGRPARYQRRDRLVGLLWPELDQTHARGALRKAVHAARAVLGADTVLSRGDEELALADGALWCDAAAFGQAEEAGRLAQALELYAGDLLPGFHLAECAEFGRWLDDTRQELRERAAGAAWALAGAARARRAAHRGGALGAARGALRVGRRAGAPPRDHAARPARRPRRRAAPLRRVRPAAARRVRGRAVARDARDGRGAAHRGAAARAGAARRRGRVVTGRPAPGARHRLVRRAR
jgi:hypothetical protein